MTAPIDPKLSERLRAFLEWFHRPDFSWNTSADRDIERLIPQAADAIDALQAQLSEWREHAALSDKELCDMSDWLIGNAEFDPKTGLIDRAKKLRERIRDLIAAEGELGDTKVQLAKAQKERAEMRDLLELARHNFIQSHAKTLDELESMPTPYDKALMEDK